LRIFPGKCLRAKPCRRHFPGKSGRALSTAGATIAGVTAAIVARLRAAGCVFAEDEAAVLQSCAATPDELAAMVDRRVSGVPLEQVVGWAAFAGLRITVRPGVFVPRRRTECLVRRAAAVAPPRAIVVDLCCGSGAIGAALAATADIAELYAVDIDPVAVECARANLAEFGGVVLAGDLFAPLPARLRGRVDILVANVPYVPSDAVALMPPESRLHEPRATVDGGADGLDVLRRVAAEAADWLAAGGHFLVETSADQAPTAAGVIEQAGLTPEIAGCPDLDATIVLARRR
jgi:release factor glutamine methyltransferase